MAFDLKLNKIINKHKLNEEEKKEFLSYIKDIYNHKEFQFRLSEEFPHHGKITLGEHIIEDAVVSYKLAKKYKKRKKYNDIDVGVCVKIAMFHDLYTIPYQNNSKSDVNKFFNKHGFRHPIESVINSIIWYPNLYTEENKEKIIDGIVHHMWPLPVLSFNNEAYNILELKNFDKLGLVSENYKDILVKSTKRKKRKRLSFSKSKYKEGKIVSKADKLVSIKQIKSLSSFIMLFTGNSYKGE